MAIFPTDRRMPGMDVALHADAIAGLFDESFGDITVRECHPYYVRYKPERYAQVQYRLECEGADGRTVPVTAHLALYPPARAAKLAARYGAARGRADSNEQAVYVDRIDGLAQLFPTDVGLPGLRTAASPEAMGRRFQRHLAHAFGGDVRGCRVELVRYKAQKRAVLKFDVAGLAPETVYGKLRNDGAGRLHRIGAAMRRSGVPTPRTLAWWADLGMVIQASGEGARLADLRDTDDYLRWMPEVADALASLHLSRVEGLPRYSPDDEVRDLQDTAAIIGSVLPSMEAFATELCRRLAALLCARDGNVTTTHGSFHDDQVLVGDAGVEFIDTDGAIVGPPHSDVGLFLSYLSAEGCEAGYRLFLDRYLSVGVSSGTEYLLFEAASLLRWATLPFRELRRDWPEQVEGRVLGAAARLRDYERNRTT
ncbi:MAG TPA: phosphotransferase [Actinomycetota bacterium]|nr:phosphotransferase [Actinomycetota bacterium]